MEVRAGGKHCFGRETYSPNFHCLLLTFLAYVEREHIAVTSYESTASGTVERVGEKYQFTRSPYGLESSWRILLTLRRWRRACAGPRKTV